MRDWQKEPVVTRINHSLARRAGMGVAQQKTAEQPGGPLDGIAPKKATFVCSSDLSPMQDAKDTIAFANFGWQTHDPVAINA